MAEFTLQILKKKHLMQREPRGQTHGQTMLTLWISIIFTDMQSSYSTNVTFVLTILLKCLPD